MVSLWHKEYLHPLNLWSGSHLHREKTLSRLQFQRRLQSLDTWELSRQKKAGSIYVFVTQHARLAEKNLFVCHCERQLTDPRYVRNLLYINFSLLPRGVSRSITGAISNAFSRLFRRRSIVPDTSSSGGSALSGASSESGRSSLSIGSLIST